ncbi:MAG: serine/threonine-protein kinase RsbW [Phycisphaerales bacterium]|jgi:serine/threonine-protein kinase RsbW|nr:serine/threonine-protein kinase RsbW [Phycisphaerales bacterium]
MGVAGSNRHNQRREAASDASRANTSAAAARNGNGGRGGRSTKLKPLHFTIRSDVAASRDVHKSIMDRVEAQHYDEQSTFAIRLALEEGLMNAIKHGNKLDPKKTVHVEAKVTPKSTEIIIEDQGKGFHREAVPDPCAEENLLKCSGRGILLMEAYMDKVEYSHGGRRVKMVKKKA